MSEIKSTDFVSVDNLEAVIDGLRELKSATHIDRRRDIPTVADAMKVDTQGRRYHVFPEGFEMYFVSGSTYNQTSYPKGNYQYLDGTWKKVSSLDNGDENAFNAIINEIKASIVGVYKYKGTVDKYSPSEGDESDTTYLIGDNGVASPENGDVYNVKDTGMNYAWNADEAQWDALGSDIPEELSNDEINAICQ